MPRDLSRFGEVIEVREPKVKLRVERREIASVLSSVLASYTIEDVSVEDPPLEEVIAQAFAEPVANLDGDANALSPRDPQRIIS
jgi:ABC-2 type transport system ATP-binding protein